MTPASAAMLRKAAARDAAESMQTLQQLRAEVRLQLHLASFETKQRFGALDQQLRDLEMAAQATGSAAQSVMRTLLHGFRELGDAVRSAK